jgi:hypothetical protein
MLSSLRISGSVFDSIPGSPGAGETSSVGVFS